MPAKLDNPYPTGPVSRPAAEERLGQILATISDGVWDWEIASGRLLVNDQYYRMLGYAPGAFEPTYSEWVTRIHPDDREQAEKGLATAVARLTDFSLQYRLRTHSGGWTWVLARGRVVEKGTDATAVRVIGTHTDVDHHRRLLAALKESERNYRAIFNAVDEAISVQDPVTSRVLDANDSTARIFGLKARSEVLNLDFVDFFSAEPPYDRDGAFELFRRAMAGEPQHFEWRAKRRTGERFWADVRLRRTRLGGRRVIIAVVRDVTTEHESQRHMHFAASIFENTVNGVMLTDADLNIQSVNRAFSEMTGYPIEEALGQTPSILKSGRHEADFYQDLWRSLRDVGHWNGEIRNRRKNGEVFPALLSISTIQDRRGEVSHYVGVYTDISDMKRIRKGLRYLAHHDALTRLPNRVLLRLRLEHGLQRVKRSQRQLAVMMIDLQRFSHINDSLGQDIGDAALVDVANTLRTLVRASDTVARLGGDEFVVVMEDINDRQDASLVAGRIVAAFRQPNIVRGHRIFLAVCIGISLFPNDGVDGERLLRHAGIALATAERQGVNRYAFYAAGMEAGLVERFALDTAMKEALEGGEFRLAYQPQVCLASQGLAGVEALLRWQSPILGNVSPARFVPVAEDSGLMGELGLLVLRQACEQLVEWERAGFQVPRMAVNVSVQQLELPHFVSDFQRILVETGVDASRIELEVTESLLMEQMAEIPDTLEALRDLGAWLAIDDFGTGYSSLIYLKRLPVQRLKIDRSFISDLEGNQNDEVITRAVLGLGRSLGLLVIAEGVETPEQAAFLRREGCHEAQGYLFGRPMSPSELAARWAQGGVASLEP